MARPKRKAEKMTHVGIKMPYSLKEQMETFIVGKYESVSHFIRVLVQNDLHKKELKQ